MKAYQSTCSQLLASMEEWNDQCVYHYISADENVVY